MQMSLQGTVFNKDRKTLYRHAVMRLTCPYKNKTMVKIWTERCWAAFYICQFDLDLGGACYHDGMPHRCQGTKCECVQVEENLASGMWACQGTGPGTAPEQRDSCYHHAKTGNTTPISLSLCCSRCLSLSLAHLSFLLSCSAPIFSFPSFSSLRTLIHSHSPLTLPLHPSSCSLSFSLPFTNDCSNVDASMFLNECICSRAGI